MLQAVLARVAGIGDLLVDPDQPPEHRLLLDDLGVVLYVGRGRHRGQNLPHKVQAADLRRHVLLLQTILERHQIHRLSLVEQLHHGLEHDPILVLVKIVAGDHLGGGYDSLPVHQHGTDDGLLRLHAVGKDPFYQGFIHGNSSSFLLCLNLNLCLHDLHRQGSRHILVELDGYLVGAEGL